MAVVATGSPADGPLEGGSVAGSEEGEPVGLASATSVGIVVKTAGAEVVGFAVVGLRVVGLAVGGSLGNCVGLAVVGLVVVGLAVVGGCPFRKRNRGQCRLNRDKNGDVNPGSSKPVDSPG